MKEGKRPGVLGFAEGAVAEKFDGDTEYGKSWMLGATTYRAIDPLVLTLTAAYQYRRGRTDGNTIIKPGNLMIINPQISFAANESVTLMGGLTWRNQGSSTSTGQRSTTTSLNLGFAYLWDEHTTLNLISRSDVSGSGGTEIGLAVQIKLGDLTAVRLGSNGTGVNSTSPGATSTRS